MSPEQQSKNPMDRIAHLLEGGRVAEAELFCRNFLELHREDVNVMGMLGAILLKQRRLDEAEATLKRTIDLAPTFARPHEDLGMLYMSRNLPQDAVPCLRRAIELEPRSPNALLTLAHAFAALGRKDDAETAHKKYVALSPAAQAIERAAQFMNAGDPENAESCCQELLNREPNNVEALRMLARIASDDERYVIAEGLLRRIIEIAPGSLRHQLDLARFLAERSRFPEVVEVCDRAISIDPDNADALLLRGDAFSVIGRAADALDAYDRCLALRADDPQALVGRGNLLRVAGQRTEAIACLARCIDLRPNFGDAWWSLASLRGFAFSDQQHEQIRSMIDGGQLDARNETLFRFALARSYEDRDDFDRAWEELVAANRMKRAQVSYDPVETETRHDDLVEVCTREFLERERQTASSNSTPIFIVGMPRSGSTLIEQILASHSDVDGRGELPYILMISSSLSGRSSSSLRYPKVLQEMTDRQLSSMGLTYLHHAESHRMRTAAMFTDKMPGNFSHAGFVSLILPQAKIIDARRDPIDTCVANFRQLYASGKNQTYDLTELGEYYLQYVRMMHHWDSVLPGKVLRVQYEDVVSDLEGQVRRLLDHCGLPFDNRCLRYYESERAVNTASAEQVRQPIYRDAVGFWRNYEKHLGELLEILEPVLE